MKQAVVVGATGLLGKAVCEELQENGYSIEPTWLSPGRPDVTESSAFENLPEKIDLAIYLAGINHIETAISLSDADWQRVIDINLTGAFRFARGAFKGLSRAGESHLIFISSIMATHPYPCRVAYASAKSGIEGLTRSLAVEWGESGISVNAIRLGHLDGLMRSSAISKNFLDNVKASTPSGKLINPKTAAKYICWLSMNSASEISGSVFDLDPAYTINRFPRNT